VNTLEQPHFTESQSENMYFPPVIRKPKLIGYWRRTSETGSSGASIIAYNNITAFKFPDKMQVYLTCNIEVRNIQHYHIHVELLYTERHFQ
jgi:hypothetical protein